MRDLFWQRSCTTMSSGMRSPRCGETPGSSPLSGRAVKTQDLRDQRPDQKSRTDEGIVRCNLPAHPTLISGFKDVLYDWWAIDVSVEQFMADYEWLYMTLDYAEPWKSRWCGRSEWNRETRRRFDA
jgi:hypothetical protein